MNETGKNTVENALEFRRSSSESRQPARRCYSSTGNLSEAPAENL